MRFYHGTDAQSALNLLRGAPLDEDAAAALHTNGEPGFYLAFDEGDAEFFATRHGQGSVLTYDIADHALEALLASGAATAPVAQGPRTPRFAGQELYIPPSLFSTFNALLTEGDVSVRAA